MACSVLASPQDLVDPKNILFDEGVKQYLQEHGEKMQDFADLMKYQLVHLLKSN